MEQEQIQNLITELKEIKGIVQENHTKLHNHITHLEMDTKVLQTEISWLKEMKEDFKILRDYIFENRPQKENLESKDDIKAQQDVEWLKKTYWIIVTASLGGLIAGLLNLLLK